MKLSITGGAGYIGSPMVRFAQNLNHDVTVLDNFSTGRIENLKHIENKIEIIECDLSKADYWSKYFN